MSSDDFFSVASVVTEALGEDACARLIEVVGGQRICIPRRVGGRLHNALGPDILTVLVERFGGMEIDIPSRAGWQRKRNAARLRRDALHSDMTANAIAARHGVTAAYVHKLRGKARKAKASSKPAPKPARTT